MNLGVANQSDFRDNNCSNSLLMWSGWKHKKRKALRKEIHHGGEHSLNTELKMVRLFLVSFNMQAFPQQEYWYGKVLI